MNFVGQNDTCSVIISGQDLINLHQISENFVILHDRSQLRAICVNVQTPPGRGCEVFVNNLPRDILMKRLYDFMVFCGDIYEIRLLMDFSGFNRGMSYVKYRNGEAARMAALVLNACEIQPGYPVTIKISFENNQLILKMIPRRVTYEQVAQEMASRVGDGLISVTSADQPGNKNNNSYSVLLKYETHRQALEARKMLWPVVQLRDAFFLIDWAEPQDVRLTRVLYFKNFPKDKTRFDLFEFLKSVTNIHTIVKIHVDSGAGYIVFSSDRYRKMVKEILKDCLVFGRKLALRGKKSYTSSVPEETADQSQSAEIERPIGERRFDFIADDVPSFNTPPVYTNPGIFNELGAIKHVIHNFLHKRFPCSTWCVVDPNHEEVSGRSQMIKLMLTVNNAKYTFLFVQVHADPVATTPYKSVWF